MRSYKEIIQNDIFHADDEYFVDSNVFKMCWGCEKKYKSGHMVWDASKFRRIFFCENCYGNLEK